MGGYGQKPVQAYRVCGLVKVKAYARRRVLLVGLLIVHPEGKCKQGTKRNMSVLTSEKSRS